MNPRITRLSGVRSLDHLKKYYYIPEFRIGGIYHFSQPDEFEFGGNGGVTLESLGSGPLRTAYIATGVPEFDKDGKIINAVIINSYYSGDSTWMYYFWFKDRGGNKFALGPVVGPGELIDTDKHFVIFLDSLGLWGASKPSDGLGRRFPRYSIYDVVQANYRLLVDHLNVGRVKLATGCSNGATQSYVWAMIHPGFIEKILPIGGSISSKDDPIARWTFQLMSQAMVSDPVWRETKGDYYHLPKEKHPNQGMMFGWSIILKTAMGLEHRLNMGWDEVQKEVFSWAPEGNLGIGLREKARNYDVNDLLARNACQEDLHITPHLSEINAETLIIHIENDLWLSPKLAQRAAELIKSAEYVSFENKLGHYGLFQAPNILNQSIKEFITQ